MTTAAFAELVRLHHRVAIRTSGSQSSAPPLDSATGFWLANQAAKSPRALLLVQLEPTGGVVCRLPSQYDGTIRLGQLNISSLTTPALVGFTLMVATQVNDAWVLAGQFTWTIVVRLTAEAVAAMKAAYAQTSLSSVAFFLNPDSGTLSSWTANKQVECSYLAAGLAMNHAETDLPWPGITSQITYGETTQAIHRRIVVSPAHHSETTHDNGSNAT